MNKTMVWVDIETTGDNLQQDHIIELAVGFSDEEGLLIPANPIINSAPKSFIGLCPYTITEENKVISNPYVWDMHKKNNLINEHNSELMEFGSQPSKVEKDIIEYLGGLKSLGQMTMCGLGIHFDRAFIRHNLPMLHACFNHKCFDLQTVYGLLNKIDPDVSKEIKADVDKQNYDDHRANRGVMHNIILYRESLKAIKKHWRK